MKIKIDGRTRLYFILGDPIAQVKSPSGMSAAFQREGIHAAMLPAQIASTHLLPFLGAVDHLNNCDGLVITVPHKFACFEHCSTVSQRASVLGAVNVMRRIDGGGWHGDMLDGLGFVNAAEARGLSLAGKQALLIGAGGAGSAIAFSLLQSRVAGVAVHDLDVSRRDALIEKLRHLGNVRAGSWSPAGYDVIANATPAGMSGHDYYPVDVNELSERMFVGCVVTKPEITPLIAAARQAGCTTATGVDMYRALEGLMVDFFSDRSER
ncbi:shikimate dehydrogenase [Mesorhizobium sp. M3A.F.Ca.ET.174.01.1.1]|uniref:shikimate dehydrogenase family protein n=1 Tax=unclassified Mesorhizobium TaxID=325217 RepID=UPI001093ED48|nr:MULTISPECIES: shikimate dehydrogenase [unclassified Mesorhizobium]TGS81043.1 shikimate dehydrogenase [Mesorhizobium sp. M3A.F.Ca.ET.175.01.1.1]TGT21763.1 shikimate dehydrogenase [Mesorhizobium sp. M3A.F.Ca.ET.174.01.1.1]